MEGEWLAYTVSELQRDGILLVEDGNHGEYRPLPGEFVPTGVAFIRAADMDNGRVLFESASRINETAFKRITKGVGAPGDVILSHKGTVGKIAIVDESAPIFVCSPQTTFWRSLDRKKLSNRYLHAFMRSPFFKKQLNERAGETDMAPYVSLTSQRTFKVILPPLPTQRAIAHILGTLDDKIELNRRLNATLESMARALFQSWFVDFDPVRAKMDGRQPAGMDADTAALFPNSFEESELGLIPKGWCGGRVSTVTEFGRTSINPSQSDDELFDHYSLPAFDDGRAPKVELGSTIMSNKLLVTANCVLLSKLNPHIPRIWLPHLNLSRRSVCSTEYIVATARKGFSKEYLYSLFTSSTFATTYGTLVTGTTGSHQRIRAESVLDMPIVVPPEQSVHTFTAKAKTLFELVNRNTIQSRILATLRDTLLPKLLSGELSVKHAEKLVGEST